ncbi:MAG: hypothetical protein H6Q08_708, partial [Acidobacteria bacterium]|nr:hypothetical protein [Acidobacteriota bacterium]
MRATSAVLAGVILLGMWTLAASGVPQSEDPAVLLRAAIEKE